MVLDGSIAVDVSTVARLGGTSRTANMGGLCLGKPCGVLRTRSASRQQRGNRLLWPFAAIYRARSGRPSVDDRYRNGMADGRLPRMVTHLYPRPSCRPGELLCAWLSGVF